MKLRGVRGRVRRKAVWGADTSEPVAAHTSRPMDGRKKMMPTVSA